MTDKYEISTRFAHGIMLTILASMLGLVGYMIQWASTDAAFKAGISARLESVETQVRQGQLPRADERLKAIERDIHSHEED